MDVFELYKPFRNKVAQLSYSESFYVIWAYSQYMQIKKFEMPNDIDVKKDFFELQVPQQWIAEWELEILAKEVILNGSVASQKGQTIRSWETLSRVVNRLKDLENDIYGQYGSSANVLIEMVRIAHRQFIWQSNPPNSITLTRYFKIFNQKIINEVCLDRLGLTVQDIYLCGTAIMGVFLSRSAINTPVKSNIDNIAETKIKQFLSFTCRTISELKAVLKSEQRYDDRFPYAYNSLRAYPLIHMTYRGRDAVVCPLPTLLFWRFTGGLYYELLEDKRLAQAFGDSFQEYVGQVIEKACPRQDIGLLAEQQYGSKKARKDSVDWIVSEESFVLFLECKAKRLSWNAKESLDDLASLEADIDSMASAVVQVYKTINDYLDGQYRHFPFVPDRKLYPVVVTLENWRMFGPDLPGRLHNAIVRKLGSVKISEDVLVEMPYAIWPIEQLEVAMQIIYAVGVQDFMDGKINDAEMNQWEWETYMRNRFPERFPVGRLFDDEYREIFSGLMG